MAPACFGLALLVAGTAEAEVPEPARWDFEWIATEEPEAGGLFTIQGTEPMLYEILDDTLVVRSGLDGALYWLVDEAAAWRPEPPLLVEFEMRCRDIDPGAESAAQVVFTDGMGRLFNLELNDLEWRRYRLLFDGQSVAVFLDDDISPVRELQGQEQDDGSMASHFYFGDASSGVGGVSEWRYIRWGRVAAD